MNKEVLPQRKTVKWATMRTGLLKEIYKNKSSYLFILPMYAFLAVFLIIPAIQGLYMAFFDFKMGSEKHFVGFNNFMKLFGEQVFWTALKNTFYLVLGVVPLSLLLSLIISVVIINSGTFLKSFVRGAFYLPLVVSGVTLALTWKFIYDPVVGMANYYLGLLGFERIIWLGDPKYAMLAVMIVIFTYNLGKPIILYMAALGGIPETYYEAARIDGASKGRQFFHITLPMLKPTTLYLMVTGTIGVFQTFVIIKLLTTGGPNNATQTLAYLLYEKAFVFGQYGVACAVGTVLFLLVTSIALLQYKFLSTDIEY
jgi:multiple sugar transport system permease protein